jgi:hypothetical protein
VLATLVSIDAGRPWTCAKRSGTSEDLKLARHSRLLLHGRALGAAIGATVCLAAAFVIDWIRSSRQDGIFSLPAMIVTALFVGAMGGLMFASIIVGGREDDRATRAAEAALAQERRFDHVN